MYDAKIVICPQIPKFLQNSVIVITNLGMNSVIVITNLDMNSVIVITIFSMDLEITFIHSGMNS